MSGQADKKAAIQARNFQALQPLAVGTEWYRVHYGTASLHTYVLILPDNKVLTSKLPVQVPVLPAAAAGRFGSTPLAQRRHPVVACQRPAAPPVVPPAALP